jgi:hypothetical protein
MSKANKGLHIPSPGQLVKRLQKTGGALFSALSLFALVGHASEALQANYEILELDGQGAIKRTQLINVQRSANRVYRKYPQQGVAEMWQRSSRGAVHYQRIYFPQQLIINYGAGDITSLRSNAALPTDLRLIGRQLDPRWRTLPRCGEKLSAQGKALCFGSAKVELYWLDEQALPLSANWHQDGRHYRLRLLSLLTLKLASLQTQLEGFEQIDFADIGDNEAHSGLATINSGQFRGIGYRALGHH